jgi:hypothetical protein
MSEAPAMLTLAHLIVRVFWKPHERADDILPVLMFVIISLLVIIAILLSLRLPSTDAFDVF